MFLRVQADSIGLGFSLQGGATEYSNHPLVVASIEEGGPAARYVRGTLTRSVLVQYTVLCLALSMFFSFRSHNSSLEGAMEQKFVPFCYS